MVVVIEKEELLDELEELLGSDNVLQNETLEGRYAHIWTMNHSLNVKAMVLPSTTEEVAEVCKLCYKHNQKVVVFGGLTNLVGGTETNRGDLVISMEKLNTIEQVNLDTRTMTVQSGVILEAIHNEAASYELQFPLSFGAKGSCQIGGCISTNAGGLRVLRYGMTRQQILGLEVVLPDGTIISSLKEIVKDNSGIDLKHLFIGSEGTLGIVTKAVLQLREAHLTQNTAYVAMDSFTKVIEFLRFMERGCGGALSAFELLWPETYATLTGDETVWNAPIPQGYSYYVLIDILGADIGGDKLLLQRLLEEAIAKELIVDGSMAHSDSDIQWFWNLREDVSILSKKYKYNQHFDISLPISSMSDYLSGVRKRLLELSYVNECFVFGHVADGNMHLVVGKENREVSCTREINSIVYSPLTGLKGSVSAEHGIGIHKKEYLSVSRTEEEITLMKLLKRTIDPKNLLNSGRIID